MKLGKTNKFAQLQTKLKHSSLKTSPSTISKIEKCLLTFVPLLRCCARPKLAHLHDFCGGNLASGKSEKLRRLQRRTETNNVGAVRTKNKPRAATKQCRKSFAIIEASFTRIHIHNLRKMGIIVSCSNYSRYTVNAFRLNVNLIDGNLSQMALTAGSQFRMRAKINGA